VADRPTNNPNGEGSNPAALFSTLGLGWKYWPVPNALANQQKHKDNSPEKVFFVTGAVYL